MGEEVELGERKDEWMSEGVVVVTAMFDPKINVYDMI